MGMLLTYHKGYGAESAEAEKPKRRRRGSAGPVTPPAEVEPQALEAEDTTPDE